MGDAVLNLACAGLRKVEPELRKKVMALGERIADEGAARAILGRDVSILGRTATKAATKDAAAASAAARPWTTAIMKLFSALGEKAKGQPAIAINQEIGAAREDLVMGELGRLFPQEDGYRILRQPYLRDSSGSIVRDVQTRQSRRLDFVVYRNHRVVRALEVTSRTADKVGQMAKEARIRQFGGSFIKDMETGDLLHLPSTLKTRVYRIQ